MFNDAGLALVVADARGTGASFGSRDGELGEGEIADFNELIDWAASWPWSNGRIGVYGTSYDGQAAELVARHRNPHLAAVAALFSPNDPYRQLFYPGGVATSGRFARWMCESQVKDGVVSARGRLAELLGRPAEALDLPPHVKPVDGEEGEALRADAIAEHQSNADVHTLMDLVPFRDDSVQGLDWQLTAPSSAYEAIASSGVPMFVRAGWVDGAFVVGALMRFAHRPNNQTVEIGPWGHGGRTRADPLRPSAPLDENEFTDPRGQDRRLVEFFSRHLAEEPVLAVGRGTLLYSTLGTDRWTTVDTWPPEGIEVRRLYADASGTLTRDPPSEFSLRLTVDPAASTGETNRWLAGEIGEGASYPRRQTERRSRLTFTSQLLDSDLHVLGFPVMKLRLATNGTDGVVYVYLEDVSPDGSVSYVTEGCLRFMHRATTEPIVHAGLGVPRSFARADRRPVIPNEPMNLIVELLPVSALIRAGHRLRVSVAGHDASCFSYHGAEGETFTLAGGDFTALELPVLG
ncbi:CocE/NonD family hydrolase [Microbacterium sp. KUDC0406]|nr:CocE/NonD family hydrolase [Microbacterium sp. KUDC0406]